MLHGCHAASPIVLWGCSPYKGRLRRIASCSPGAGGGRRPLHQHAASAPARSRWACGKPGVGRVSAGASALGPEVVEARGPALSVPAHGIEDHGARDGSVDALLVEDLGRPTRNEADEYVLETTDGAGDGAGDGAL